ncbi:MAG: hypothetical protein EXS08_06085 [Planctomycetes bacterium]|nr:hypothetical protein [Planctomycetota bacterium]
MGEPSDSPPRRGAWLGFALAGVLLAWHLASFDITTLPIVSDVRFYLYFAWRVCAGAVPHRDFFDHKTQLASFVGAGLQGLGGALGVDPLLAIRAGYLALAGATGLLAYAVQRRLAYGSALAGGLGALAYCSFGLLGLLPATGCVPKELVALCASGAALLAHRQRWLAAGALGALAALDWQIGALAWLGVFLAAALCAEDRRRAALRVVAGGALGVLPYFAYFALHGALGAALTQSIGGSLDRSAGTQARDSFGARLERIGHLVSTDCAAQTLLVALSLVGVGVAFVWLVKRRELRTLLVPLLVVHLGIAAFSLFDFQWHADLFVLLHGVAFFLALAWSGLWSALAPRLGSERARKAAGAALLAVVFVCARPGALRPELTLETPMVLRAATLADQREVAAELEQRSAGRTVAYLESVEQLYLQGRVNPLPLVFWNGASWANVRKQGEEKDDSLRRLLRACGAEAWVTAQPIQLDGPGTVERVASRNGQYFVMLQTR